MTTDSDMPIEEIRELLDQALTPYMIRIERVDPDRLAAASEWAIETLITAGYDNTCGSDGFNGDQLDLVQSLLMAACIELPKLDPEYVEPPVRNPTKNYPSDATPEPTGAGWYIRNGAGWWGPMPWDGISGAFDPEPAESVYFYTPEGKAVFHGYLTEYVPKRQCPMFPGEPSELK